MGVEIEYKFLVADAGWRDAADTGVWYRQGYLASTDDSGIRVSIAGGRASLTIKKAQSLHTRLEFEYPIPVADAEQLLACLCNGHLLEKTRYRVPHAGHLWEVDVFAGSNAGLVVAEIELTDEQERFERPAWVGTDISADPRYYAMNLARTPHPGW